MRQYIIRLDDASEYMDVDKWNDVARVLNRYQVRPIFGIIPNNRDPKMTGSYEYNENFWDTAHRWIRQGWIPALHGYDHRYITDEGGINPVNNYSEFAGVPYDEQAMKMREGYKILLEHDIRPDIFFAPAHTYDENTILALKSETDIRCISDTVATNVYERDGIKYIPLLAGRIRNIPIHVATFCYHPNTMTKRDIERMDTDIRKYMKCFSCFEISDASRVYTMWDSLLQFLYFKYRWLKKGFFRLLYGR